MARPLISYYGDDFTGSTDVMEALAANGVETVLFLTIPDDRLMARFADAHPESQETAFEQEARQKRRARAFGLAGSSRSQTPDWMDVHLRAALGWLKALDAELCHYKVCSTFDSAPHAGNIGRAIEIGRATFGAATVPLIIGAPQIRRYTAFGELFADYQGRTYRIDRHPVMAHHPVTPMEEANLLCHLAQQTKLSTALIDNIAMLDAPVIEDVDILMLDVLDKATQDAAGHLLWHHLRQGSRFVCGSSGVEYALIQAWRESGLIGEKPNFDQAGPVERIAVVSGSVSPTTERQIRHALERGFGGVALDPLALTGDNAVQIIADAVEAALEILASGQSVILYTALGPDTERSDEIDALKDTKNDVRHHLGQALGRIQSELVKRAKLRRIVIAGGDTSSHALGEMGIGALTLKMPLPQTPGSPLCLAHMGGNGGGDMDGLQIALKGGQIGGDNYFSLIRDGTC